MHIYSRNSEDNTTKYPDIIARMPKVLKDSVKSAVVDAEAVAWDPEKKEILPFQVLSTRKRKVGSNFFSVNDRMTAVKVEGALHEFHEICHSGTFYFKQKNAQTML